MLRKTECSEHSSKWLLFPPLAKAMRIFLSDLNCKNLVGFLEIKLTKTWGLSLPWACGFLTGNLFYMVPPAICSSQFAFSWPVLVPVEILPQGVCAGNCDSLSLLVYLYTFEGSSLSCVLSSLRDPRRVLDFQSVQYFSCGMEQ